MPTGSPLITARPMAFTRATGYYSTTSRRSAAKPLLPEKSPAPSPEAGELSQPRRRPARERRRRTGGSVGHALLLPSAFRHRNGNPLRRPRQKNVDGRRSGDEVTLSRLTSPVRRGFFMTVDRKSTR